MIGVWAESALSGSLIDPRAELLVYTYYCIMYTTVSTLA